MSMLFGLIVYIVSVLALMKFARHCTPAGRLQLVVAVGAIPAFVFSVVFLLADGQVHEGVGAAYMLPLFVVALPFLGLVGMCLLDVMGSSPRGRWIGALVLASAFGLIGAPYVLMKATGN
ncbi:MAG: hypothetical protein RLZZ618_3177 [Pseudomonadota bacterium]|jgi:hypothetical protein